MIFYIIGGAGADIKVPLQVYHEELKNMKLIGHSKVIALDGAADLLMGLNIVPDVVIGDLDSISEEALEWCSIRDIAILKINDQEYTDLEKAIHYLDEFYFRENEVVGCELEERQYEVHVHNCLNHLRLDHFVYNLALIQRMYCKYRRRRTLFYSVTQKMEYFFCDFGENFRIKLYSDFDNAIVGLFGAPHAVVTTQGLKYDLSFHKLHFPCFSSSSNSIAKKSERISKGAQGRKFFAELQLHEGALLLVSDIAIEVELVGI